MKQYLVAYDIGKNVTEIKMAIVEMEDDYCPANDNMKALKEKVVKENKPRYVFTRNGYMNFTEWNNISADKLGVVAVFNLNI